VSGGCGGIQVFACWPKYCCGHGETLVCKLACVYWLEISSGVAGVNVVCLFFVFGVIEMENLMGS
jgi:hypothetical protein